MTVSDPCAVHPETEARAEPCDRCNNYFCDACFISPESPTCPRCQADREAEARDEARKQAHARPTAIAAKMVMVACWLGLANVGYGLVTGHYFRIVFPVAGLLLGMSLPVLSFALFAPPKDIAGQRVRGLIFVCMTLGGLLAGVALNWRVLD